MELKVNAVHFDATEKLHEFIEKKAAKLQKNCEQAIRAEFVLKVVKPETAKNKETALSRRARSFPAISSRWTVF